MAMTEVFMSSNRQYTDEFKSEAVKQVVERGFTVVDVATRIGIPRHTLYGWVQSARKAAGSTAGKTAAPASDSAEVRRLKAELKRVTEERDILKKGSSPNSGESCSDFEEEVVVVAEAVGDAFDDFDFVVDALDEIGAERVFAVGEDSWDVRFEPSGEAFERLDAGAHGAVVPLLPEFSAGPA